METWTYSTTAAFKYGETVIQVGQKIIAVVPRCDKPMLGTVREDGGLEYQVQFEGGPYVMRAYHWQPYTVYLAGPMTGFDELNFPAFMAAAKRLRDKGFIVKNPAELSKPREDQPWSWWMRRCLAEMFTCDAIVVLPHSIFSEGATGEAFLGRNYGMPVFSEEGLLSYLAEPPTEGH